MPRAKQEERINPQWLVVKTIGMIILLGAVLLTLPWSARSGAWTDPVTALFMSTSAVCVTGHSLVDLQQYFTPFGQLVILALIQVGGLGFMMMGTLLLTIAGRRISMQSELALMDVLRIEEARDIKSLLKRSLLFSLGMELCGAALLAWRFHAAHGQTPGRALYNGLFHAVSAYCNAGFTLFRGSLTDFRGDAVVMALMALLIVAGGLGFIVIYDISRYKVWRLNRWRRGHLLLHTKVALLVSAFLLLLGAAAFAALEWHRTLQPLPWPEKFLGAVFHSVTARTAGFNVVDMAAVRPATRFLNMALMFIGGSPGSTAGGIKTTTAAVLLAATLAMMRGRDDTLLLHRRLSVRNVEEALSIFLLSLVSVAGLYGLLLLTEHSRIAAGMFPVEFLMFDTVSAFGTVGLSTGIMPLLSQGGRVLITICMFIGRVGPLTVAMLVSVKGMRHLVRCASEDVMVG